MATTTNRRSAQELRRGRALIPLTRICAPIRLNGGLATKRQIYPEANAAVTFLKIRAEALTLLLNTQSGGCDTDTAHEHRSGLSQC